MFIEIKENISTNRRYGMGTLEKTMHLGGETQEIWRFGVDDYAVNFIEQDCSVRGTLMEIMSEIFEVYAEEIFEQ